MTTPTPDPARPWNVPRTTLWGIGILGSSFVAFLSAVIVVGTAIHVRRPGTSIRHLMPDSLYDLVTTGVGATALLFGTLLPVLLRDEPVRDTLALRWPGLRATVLYLAVTLLWITSVAVVGPAFGHTPGLFLDDHMQGSMLAFLGAALIRILGVPLAVEVFARGFLYRGFVEGRRFRWPGVLLVTLAGMYLHCFFYASGPIYWFLATFESAILTAARTRSGSLTLPLLLHVLLVAGLFGPAVLAGPR